MINVIQMSIEEYEALLKIQNEPTKLVEDTAENYKQNLIVATQYIDMLEKELKTYRIAGVPQKPKIEAPEAKGIKRKSWTKPEDKAIFDAKTSGQSIKHLAQQLNRTIASVESRVRKLNLFVVKGQVSQYKGK